MAVRSIDAAAMRNRFHVKSRRTFFIVIFLIFVSAALYNDYTKRRPWLHLPTLHGYYNGINTIPRLDRPRPPTPSRYTPYNISDPAARRTCYLDAENTVSAPDIYAYDGVPRYMPQPLLGSYELLKIRDDVCFDRFGRYGPYGLGYSTALGGVGFENETESAHSEHVWAETGQIDYHHVDWADAQQRCYESNQDEHDLTKSQSRTAVVVRGYEGFAWTPLVILNLRAMITELSLKTGGAYSVHILMQIKDARLSVHAAADPAVRHTYLTKHIPAEFHGLVTLWSERQMKRLYPGDFSRYFRNPTGKDVHDVYRSPHLPLQTFAQEHPEFAHFWNWELDVRVVGSYYEMLDSIGRWADKRARELLWEQNERYYIPRYHGSWDNFTSTIRRQEGSREQLPLGPLKGSWRKKLKFEEDGGSVLPADCVSQPKTCGIDEPADLVTLNPIFDVARSDWFFTQDVTGYPSALRETLPRRAAIVTAGRYSRRLLLAMHEEVRRHGHTMFAEMFPASMALHHGFKAVYAPHPVYAERAWQGEAVDGHFNSGERGSTSGKGGPFSLATEKVHDVASWYYKSRFAQQLWRRWLGYANGEEESGGRMCLRSMLVHPIKHEHPSE